MQRYFGTTLLLAVSLFSQTPETSTAPKAIPAFLTVSHAHAVNGQHTYYRILTVVPMVGSGRPRDPKRPMYAPLERQNPASREDIIAFTHVPSDDGNFSIVEFVAADRNAFKEIYANKSLKIFEKGKTPGPEIELFLRTYRKQFVLQNFGAVTR